MGLSMDLWEVNKDQLTPIDRTTLDLEERLERWVEQDTSLLGLDALVIGRQVRTEYGGFIDLLCIDAEGNLVIVELKRRKTPRDIVAQCLDYGSWIHGLSYDEILTINDQYRSDTLSTAYSEFFGSSLPDILNNDYQLVIVADSLDDATERIVQHLNDVHKVNINAVFFNVFSHNGVEYIGRSWLKDPKDVESRAESTKKSKWTGFLFVNTGITFDGGRDWDLCRKYNFISAGGGPRWVAMIRKLKTGDKIFAYIKSKGYVGYGIIREEAVRVRNFVVNGGRLLDALPDDHPWQRERDPRDDEWLARVEWETTYDANDAQWFKGAFANQNVVCKLRDQKTYEFLIRHFNVDLDVN